MTTWISTTKLPTILVVALALAAWGCMKPNPLLDLVADGGLAEDESGGDGDTGTDGDGGDPWPDGGDTTADIPSGEVSACALLDIFDAECGTCMSRSCCELAVACAQVEDCACLADCLVAGRSQGACKIDCGGAKPDDTEELAPLLECASDTCSAAC